MADLKYIRVDFGFWNLYTVKNRVTGERSRPCHDTMDTTDRRPTQLDMDARRWLAGEVDWNCLSTDGDVCC